MSTPTPAASPSSIPKTPTSTTKSLPAAGRRQQLQVLRNLNRLEFLGHGRYHLL